MSDLPGLREHPDHTPQTVMADEARAEQRRVLATGENIRHAHRPDCRCPQCLNDIREDELP